LVNSQLKIERPVEFLLLFIRVFEGKLLEFNNLFF